MDPRERHKPPKIEIRAGSKWQTADGSVWALVTTIRQETHWGRGERTTVRYLRGVDGQEATLEERSLAEFRALYPVLADATRRP